MLDFSKLPIFRTNSFFLSNIYIRLLKLWKLRNQQKPVLATYTPKRNLKQVPEKVFSCIFHYKASDKSVIEVILKKLQRRCHTIEGLELLYMIKIPSFSCIFQALAVAH